MASSMVIRSEPQRYSAGGTKTAQSRCTMNAESVWHRSAGQRMPALWSGHRRVTPALVGAEIAGIATFDSSALDVDLIR